MRLKFLILSLVWFAVAFLSFLMSHENALVFIFVWAIVGLIALGAMLPHETDHMRGGA